MYIYYEYLQDTYPKNIHRDTKLNIIYFFHIYTLNKVFDFTPSSISNIH